MSELRGIPSVDKLLLHPYLQSLITTFGRKQVVEAVREVLIEIRVNHHLNTNGLDEEVLIKSIETHLSKKSRMTLIKVINATGVILHTNLGRAPLSENALKAVMETASGFSSLEFDLEQGSRGSRSEHSREILCRLTGAEDALVVNNNASAVLLCLSALAARRKVVISRSQLVEIGGGFRIPDVMKQSGAKLVEIGTTNRVHLADYEEALKENPALVMRAHTSNFKLVGFTSRPTLAEIVTLAHQFDVPLLDDLGSGALLDTSKFGLSQEPMVQDSIKAEADLVCFSGDKLLGGPQAGIILGRKDLVAKLKRHPLARAVRADKLCLAALTATLRHYLNGEAERRIPVWQMITEKPENLQLRAERWMQEIGQGEVVEDRSTIGGGSLPDETLPTFVLSLDIHRADELMAHLRQATPPVIGRVQNGKALFDPRTVLQQEDALFIETIKSNLVRSS